ncbi:MAG: hypothetical protein HY320_11970 [Armatimonadetes bacterium]|nr:hypothetical protein [Armatimonadota bacterium]
MTGVARELLLVTRSLADAVAANLPPEHWQGLLDARAERWERLRAARAAWDEETTALLRAVEAADGEVLAQLAAMRAEVAAELASLVGSRRLSAYQKGAEHPHGDRGSRFVDQCR